MVEIKGNLMYLQLPLRYPRNTVAKLIFQWLFYILII
jgi:hypothetical protein